MNILLIQIILAGRSDDVESWMNILFVIVLAVFWAIGGIIKAKANKAGAQGEQSPRKSPRKPPVHSKEAREQMLRRLQMAVGSAESQRRKLRPVTRKPRMKFGDLQAAVRKFAVEAEQAFRPETREPAPESKQVSSEPIFIAEKEEPSEPALDTVVSLQDKQVSESIQNNKSEFLSELLTDYADTEELRKAILNYEILGRPLSLRNPSEDGIGL
jgi:hypothetical protein